MKRRDIVDWLIATAVPIERLSPRPDNCTNPMSILDLAFRGRSTFADLQASFQGA
jgi:hypothetical protein